LLGRKQQSQVARSFPNRYLFSYANKVTSLFSISCILDVILQSKTAAFGTQNNRFCNTLNAKWLSNSFVCEKYLHLYRLLFCRFREARHAAYIRNKGVKHTKKATVTKGRCGGFCFLI
jgi:conserved domain protein